jgi:hypothetical protein
LVNILLIMKKRQFIRNVFGLFFLFYYSFSLQKNCTIEDLAKYSEKCKNDKKKRNFNIRIVIFYWKKECLPTSIELPSSLEIPCNLTCSKNQYLKINHYSNNFYQCEDCPDNTYSIGDVLTIEGKIIN